MTSLYVFRKRQRPDTPIKGVPKQDELRLLLSKVKMPPHLAPKPEAPKAPTDVELLSMARLWMEALPFLPAATPAQLLKIRAMYELIT